MSGLSLYFKYSIMNIRCKMQYKAWPFLFISYIITTIINFIGVMVLFSRFGNLGYWSAAHSLMVFGIACTAYGFADCLSRGFENFPKQVRSGRFDKILLRPRTAFLQIMGEAFEFERFGRMVVGIATIIFASNTLQIQWNGYAILVATGAVIGGFLVYTGVMIIFAAISFFTIGRLEIKYIFTLNSLQYVQVPFHAMPNIIKNALTFIFPLAVCFYYPVIYIAENTTSVFAYIALPVGLLFFTVSLGIWKVCMRHYHSTGSLF